MRYIYLIIWISSEVIGSGFVKCWEGFWKFIGWLGRIIWFGICLYFLSKRMEEVGVNISYGSWGGVGLVLRRVVWIIILKEEINVISIVCIVLMIVGVVWLKILGRWD